MHRIALNPVPRRIVAAALTFLTVGLSRRAEARPVDRDSSRTGEPVNIARLGEETLVEVRIGRAATGTTLAYESPNGELLLRLNDVLDLAEIKHRVVANHIEGQITSTESFEADASSHEIRHGKQRWHMSGNGLIATNEGLVATTETISRIVAVEVLYDRSNAVVQLRNTERLPVARRVARGEARAALRRSAKADADAASLPVNWLRVAAPHAVPTLSLDYDANITRQTFSTPGIPENTAWTFNGGVTAAAPIANGQLLGRINAAGSNLSLSDLTWRRVWPEATRLTALDIGEVASRGAESRVVQGVGISNATVHQAAITEFAPMRGALPAGWGMEAWSMGKLIDATDDAGGRYDMQIPLSSGAAAVDFVAIDPSGEEHAFQRSFSPTPWFVQPKGVEYSLIAGACGRGAFATAVDVRDANGVHSTPCDWASSGDVRYGLHPGWVLRGGFDAANYSGASRSIVTTPYIGLAGLPTRQLSLEAIVAPYRAAGGAALTNFSAHFQPTPSISLASEYQKSDIVTLLSQDYTGVIDAGTGSLAPTALERASHRSTTLQISPRSWDNRYALEASESSQWWNGTMHAAYRAAVAVHQQGYDVRPYVRADHSVAGDMTDGGVAVGIESMVMARGALAEKLGSTWLRVVAEHGTAGWPETQLAIGHASARWQYNVGARHPSGSTGWMFTFSITPLLSKLQLNTTGATSTSGSAATQFVRGSAVLNLSDRDISATADASTQRGGLGGIVFLDRNANGVRDAGEPAVQDASIRVGSKMVRSDAEGRYQAIGLAALNDIDVSVDTTSLKAPWWVPRMSGVRTRIPATGIGRVDIPIVLGGIVEGRMTLPDSSTQVGEFPTVAFTNIATGTRFTVTPFSDGAFYREGLPPGRYRVTIDLASSNGVDLVAVAQEITIAGDPAADQATVVSVVLPLYHAARLGNLAP
ncbi:MAG TPA: hypothetical protein VGM82_02620 [Gemmatimonadaceae bacterium]|jgi:hypothetical protein